MEFARAVEAARTANLQFFTQLSPKELAKVMSQRDEDERTLLHANGHHMLVASEPLRTARDRILEKSFGPITAIKRL